MNKGWKGRDGNRDKGMKVMKDGGLKRKEK
jgi:hypothetical protein